MSMRVSAAAVQRSQINLQQLSPRPPSGLSFLKEVLSHLIKHARKSSWRKVRPTEGECKEGVLVGKYY